MFTIAYRHAISVSLVRGLSLTWSFILRLVKAGTFFAHFTLVKRSLAADSHKVSVVCDGKGAGRASPKGNCKTKVQIQDILPTPYV
jgi:hypothetical protein